ncbi:MAG TPA: class I mannose-6-phosphate isomerase, partial [Microlunatus sp.]
PDRANTALGYELIAPESGVLLGDDPETSVELPFQLIVARHPVAMLGQRVHELFGTSFPIRFDYLDTVNGGNLSVHTHPQPDFMRDVFGWPYTQHESYYLMVGSRDNLVYLGLQDDADLEEFHRQAKVAHEDGRQFDITRFVQTFPADPHQLFLVPAGTPHGSGAGNVVLEVSATPYLYSLRFFDWLRTDARGRQRPVHVDHAFANLDPNRRGRAVAEELIQTPRPLAQGQGWREELLGSLPEMFFEVRRLTVDPGATAEQSDDGRFHVLTLVEGDGCRLETNRGDAHDLHYAETIAVPAGVGGYRVRSTSTTPVRLVKANVR